MKCVCLNKLLPCVRGFKVKSDLFQGVEFYNEEGVGHIHFVATLGRHVGGAGGGAHYVGIQTDGLQ